MFVYTFLSLKHTRTVALMQSNFQGCIKVWYPSYEYSISLRRRRQCVTEQAYSRKAYLDSLLQYAVCEMLASLCEPGEKIVYERDGCLIQNLNALETGLGSSLMLEEVLLRSYLKSSLDLLLAVLTSCYLMGLTCKCNSIRRQPSK
jgi:hypothetical protein